MLTDPTPLQERTEQIDHLRATLTQIGRDLRHVADAVRKVRVAMPPPQDPVSLEQLLESRARAVKHARRAADALAAADDEPGLAHALADAHELVEEIRTGLASPRILDDVGEMHAEAAGRPDQRTLAALEQRVRRIGAEADRLFTLALAAQQDFFAGATPMIGSSSTEPGAQTTTADAVRELSEVIAATLAGSATTAPPPTRSADRRFGAVSGQIAASLQSYGLPHDGAQLPRLDAPDTVRAQLIDGLRRNFATRDEDGTRVYYRATVQPPVHDPALDTRLLRGAALVNANLLRAEADGVLAIVDRLPDMLRFVPAQPRGLSDARLRLRGLLDQLVATASDPLGINAERGGFQFKRLSAAVLEVLRSGEIVGPDVVDRSQWAKTSEEIAAVWHDLANERGLLADHLRARASTVRNEEVLTELCGLGQLMGDIHGRLTMKQSTTSRGIAASRLEELLAAADGSAAMLESELERFGTTTAEQEVQFLRTTGGDVSLAQLIAWVRELCAAFVGGENRAAGLLRDELLILRDELLAVSRCAGEFGGGTIASVRFGGVRRQFDELKQLIADAATQADTLANP